MSWDSPSFIYKTPEQRPKRFPDNGNPSDNEEWVLSNELSVSTALHVQSDEHEENVAKSWNVATSYSQRHHGLETRLEELQKDVDSLTLKLRADANYSMKRHMSSYLTTSREHENELDSLETSGMEETRRKGTKEQRLEAARAGNNTVQTRRELHDVMKEMDQLKFELERTKRALDAAEKKCEDVEQSKIAYDKLKARCDSLQESLDLSERIRLRQKNLLKQLQLQLQQQERGAKEKEGREMKNTAEVKTRPQSGEENALYRTAATPSRQEQKAQQNSARVNTHIPHDAMNSLVHSADQQDESKNTGIDTHEQAPSEPTGASKSRNPRSVLRPTMATAMRPGVDNLLYSSVPQSSTRRPCRIATNNARRISQTQVQQHEAMRSAASWVQSRGAAADVFTSIPRTATRTTARPKKSFLNPTQASLRRLRSLPRRVNHDRPPFVV